MDPTAFDDGTDHFTAPTRFLEADRQLVLSSKLSRLNGNPHEDVIKTYSLILKVKS